jgi:hypothetical protein
MVNTVLKPVTLHLSEEALQLAQRQADTLGLSLANYLQQVVQQNLQRVDTSEARQQRASALQRLSEAMAAEAEEHGYSEEDAMRFSKEARKTLAGSKQ